MCCSRYLIACIRYGIKYFMVVLPIQLGMENLKFEMVRTLWLN